MKFSTKVRYGVRAIIDIAMNSKGKPVLVESIANRQNISKKYLENILSTLKISGIVRSIRGAKGGYLLARKPEEITLLAIVKVFEGGLDLVDCLEAPELCEKSSQCVTRAYFGEIGEMVRNKLEKTKLTDLTKAIKMH